MTMRAILGLAIVAVVVLSGCTGTLQDSNGADAVADPSAKDATSVVSVSCDGKTSYNSIVGCYSDNAISASDGAVCDDALTAEFSAVYEKYSSSYSTDESKQVFANSVKNECWFYFALNQKDTSLCSNSGAVKTGGSSADFKSLCVNYIEAIDNPDKKLAFCANKHIYDKAGVDTSAC